LVALTGDRRLAAAAQALNDYEDFPPIVLALV
jgi:hypothetical protein